MGESLVLLERQGPVLVARLNHPERKNALSVALRARIIAVFREFENDPELRVLVLTGGDGIFSAGFDLHEVLETQMQSFVERIVEYENTVYASRKIVITAVDGFAVAGGFDLALAGDFIVAAERARFGHLEIRFGVPPFFLPLAHKVGLSRAKWLALSGALISARTAGEWGLVHEVAKKGGVLERALILAHKLADRHPSAVSVVKQAVDQVYGFARESTVSLEMGLFALDAGARRAEILEQLKQYASANL